VRKLTDLGEDYTRGGGIVDEKQFNDGNTGEGAHRELQGGEVSGEETLKTLGVEVKSMEEQSTMATWKPVQEDSKISMVEMALFML
jgi:hypothetical protein